MRTAPSSNRLLVCLLLGVGMVSSPGVSAGSPLVEKKSVSFDAALGVAQKTLEAATERKCVVAVAVVDASGIPLVLLRQDGGTEQFVEGATAKAWTAVNLRDSTAALLESIRKGEGDASQLPFVRKALLLMGGVPLRVGDVIVGGLGVAGCPDGPDDDALARRGAAVFDALVKGPPA